MERERKPEPLRDIVVVIEEHLVKTVTVKAKNAQEAHEKVRQAYRDQEIVLTADDYVRTLINVNDCGWEEM